MNRSFVERLDLTIQTGRVLAAVDHVASEGLATSAGALALGMEAIAKDAKSPYIERPKQTGHWQKIKNKDCARKEKVEFQRKT